MTNYKHDGHCSCCSNSCPPHHCPPHHCPPHNCCPPHHCPELNQTILKCGNGSGLVIPDHNENHSQLFNPYVIASVAIDTSCLKHANVKLDFSSTILFRENDGDDLRLTFQLTKTFVNGGKIPLGTWTFERDFDCCDCEAETVDSFGFTFCECDACPGCAYYTVELTNAETNGVDCVSINSPSINAIAVGPMAFNHY